MMDRMKMGDNEPREVAYGVYTRLRGIERNFASESGAAVVFGAFALYLAQRHPGVTNLDKLLHVVPMSDNLIEIVKDNIGNHWDAYLVSMNDFLEDELYVFLSGRLFFEESGRRCGYDPSEPIVGLAKSVLQIEDDDSVCDFGSGVGDFLISVAKERNAKDGAPVSGIEIDHVNAAIAEVRSIVLELPVKISIGDVFRKSFAGSRYDRVFCSPPIALREVPRLDEVSAVIREAFPDFPEITPRTLGDWLFVARVAMALKDGGRGAVVLGLGSLFRTNEEPFRNFLVRRGLLESVIELPPNLLGYLSIPVCILVLSAGNESVRMVDASRICHRERRGNKLLVSDVDAIIGMLDSPAEKSETHCVVSRMELLKEGCDLTVKRYVNHQDVSYDGIPLSDLRVRAWRGAVLRSDEVDSLRLDSKAAPCESVVKFVTPADVNGGLVEEDAVTLRSLPKGCEDFCASNGDILFCRVMSSAPGAKIAVVELAEGERLLPNGNMLVLSLDREKVDPYFVKVFLESKIAQGYFGFSSSAIQMLQISKLEKIMIPKVPLERQREIGSRCKALIDQIRNAHREIRDSREKLEGLFEDSCKDCLSVK